MDIYILIKCLFILLGLITLIIAKYYPENKFMPNESKYKVIDKVKYIRACRFVVYSLGSYYILFGLVLMTFKEWPTITVLFAPMIPALIISILSASWRKYLVKVVCNIYQNDEFDDV